MKRAGEAYSNGQEVSRQNADTLTYYFENGEVKAQGKYVNDKMQGKWIFNKKEGYLWQVGYFNEDGEQHGQWVRYNPDGSAQQEMYYENGKLVKRLN